MNAKWHEKFDFYLCDENDILHIELWNRNKLLGTTNIPINNIPYEITHILWQNFDNNNQGEILITLTITGIMKEENTIKIEKIIDKEELIKRYALINSFKNFNDVGYLIVKVYKATGLRTANYTGKSDPFCILELGNSHVQTQTLCKTLNPIWNRIFTL